MTTSVTTNSGEITKGDEIVVELTNNYQKDVGSLTIEKNFEGVPEGTDVSDLTFVITGPGGYSLTLTYAQFTDGKYVIEKHFHGRDLRRSPDSVAGPAYRSRPTGRFG